MDLQRVNDRGHRNLKTVFRAVVVVRMLGALAGAVLGYFVGSPLARDLMPEGVRQEFVVAVILICAWAMSALTTMIPGLQREDHLVHALLWRWAGHRFDGPWTHRFLGSRIARWGVRRAPWFVLVASATAVGVWGSGPVDDWFDLDPGVIFAIRAALFVLVTGTAVLTAVLAFSYFVGIVKMVVEDLTFIRSTPDPQWHSILLLQVLPPGLFRTLAMGWLVLAAGTVLIMVVDSWPFGFALQVLLAVGMVVLAAWVTVTVGNINQRYGFLAPIATVAVAMAIESEMTPFHLPPPVAGFIVAGNVVVTGFAAMYAGVGALAGHKSRAATLIRRARGARASLLEGEQKHGVWSGRDSSRWIPGRDPVPVLLRTFEAEYTSGVIWVPGPPPGYERWWVQVIEHHKKHPRPAGATLYVLTVSGPESLHSALRKLQEHLASAGPVVQGRDKVGFLVDADYLARVGPERFQRLVEEAWPAAGARWSGPDRVGVSYQALRLQLYC